MLRKFYNRNVKMTMLFIIAASIFLSFTYVLAKQVKVRYVSETNVNLRSKPSKNSKVVVVLNKGEKLYVKNYKAGWVFVKLSDGLIGWVHENYVSSEKPIKSKEVSSRSYNSLKVRYINTEGVNLRKTPSLAGSIVTVLSFGKKVFAGTYNKNGWIALYLSDGTKGWVHEKYVSASKPSAKMIEKTKIRYIIGNQVNVRKSPSLNSGIVMTAKHGKKVFVESYDEDGWVKVAFSNGTEGWVHEKFIGTSPSIMPGTKIRYIIGNNVNLRSDPSKNSSVIGSANHGEKVYVETFNNSGWAYVSFDDGVKGWVNEEFIASSPSQYPGMKVRYICGNGVNIRSKPSLKASVVTAADTGDKAFVKSYDESGWILVVLEGEQEGWVNEKFLTTSRDGQNAVTASKVRYIQGNGVNLRKSASLNSNIITTLSNGTKVYADSYDNNGWVLISTDNGRKGWVYKGYVGVDILPDDMVATSQPTKSTQSYTGSSNSSSNYYPSSNKTKNCQTSSSSGNGLINTAYSYMGVPYVWGGTTAYGFDCSGFVQRVYADNGIYITRTADSQFAEGTSVNRSELQPGDMVFFTTYTWGASHVGIYIGNSEFIHASSGAGEVTISSLNDAYYNERFLGGRRIK